MEGRPLYFGIGFVLMTRVGLMLCGVLCLIGAIDATFSASQTLERTGDGKRKRRSGPIIRRRPEASLMSFNNGATDRESDSHAIGLGGVERLEDLLRGLRR